METFPDNIKPSVSQGYSFNAPNNVMEQPLAGGTPLMIKDFKTGYVDFNITIVGGSDKMQAWNIFYFGSINGGVDKFFMDLDSGAGIEQHIVQIIPSTVNQSFNDNNIRFISYTVRAENTPFQDAEFTGLFLELFEIYGDDLDGTFERLATFALDDIPANL